MRQSSQWNCRFVIAFVSLQLIAACDSDDTTQQLTEPPGVGEYAISIDVEPDWVELPWSLRSAELQISGLGDSLVVFDSAAPCTLNAPPGDGLLVDGSAERILQPSLDEVTTVALDYVQQPWQQTYGGDVFSSFYDVLARDNGDLIACGRNDGLPWLQRVDHNGEVLWSKVASGSQADGYYSLYDLVRPGATQDKWFLAIGSGLHTEFSWRDGDGTEIVSAQVDSLSFGGLVVDFLGNLYLLGTSSQPERLATELITLNSSGAELDRRELVGRGNCIAIGLAPGPAGGLLAVRTRDVGSGLGSYAVEVLSLDDQLEITKTSVVASGEGGFGAGVIACRDGGVLVTYLSHDEEADPTASEAVRVSSTGKVLWRRRLDSFGFEELYPVAETDTGHFQLVGAAWNYLISEYRIRLVELESGGGVHFNREFNSGSKQCKLNSRVTAWDDGAVLCGVYGNWHDGQQEGWLIRMDKYGQEMPGSPSP